MPCSVVSYCTAEEDLDGRSFRGQGLRELVFHLLDSLDPGLARQVAEAKEKPFTVSPLFTKRTPLRGQKGQGRETEYVGQDRIRAGTSCRFRLTLLEDKLCECLKGFQGRPPRGVPMEIKGLKVTHTLSSQQVSDPWPRSRTYRELQEEASSTCKEVRLQFVTPTTFRRPGGVLPLPTPQSVFKGYLRAWNWFAFSPLSTDLESLIDRSILLKDFRISPALYDTGEGIRPVFTGWCRFVLAGRHHEKHIREFNLLVDYGFYCGTGDYRDVGMGMTRRI